MWGWAMPRAGLQLLVTGASGFLGWHLCRIASTTWQVHGTYYQHSLTDVDLPGVAWHRVDLTQADAVDALIERVAPDGVIHAAALSQPNHCERFPEQSYAVNVLATENLAKICGDRGIPFVFTSTDQVFDGQQAPYDETSHPAPINTYGRHKLEAEQRIRRVHATATLCRMPLMYGPATPRAGSSLQGFLSALREGRSLDLFIDEFRSPAYVEDAAQGLLLALGCGVNLLHLGGPERISRYDFGLRMAAVFGLDAGLIRPSYQADVPMPAARPADVSTNSQRAVALGYCPRDVESGLRAVLDWPGAGQS